jgi:hypothetical protein
MTEAIVEPTFEASDLPVKLAELSAHFALMAAEFDRYSKRAMHLAITTQDRLASRESVHPVEFAEIEELASLFTESGSASYDTDPIGRKCGDVGALAAVLSGAFVYANGNLVEVHGEE